MYKSSSGVRAPFKPPRPVSNTVPSTPIETSKSLGTHKRKRIESNDENDKTCKTPQRTPLKSFKQPMLSSQSTPSTQSCSSTPKSEVSVSSVKYLVQWRKVTNKKNKTWNGDGTIDVRGDMVTAKIDNRTLTKSVPKIEGIFKIGSYEVEIDCQLESNEATTSTPSTPVEPIKSTMNQIPKFKNRLPVITAKEKKLIYPKNEGSFILKKVNDSDTDVIVDPQLNKVLRPHQREGIQFMYEGIMGYNFDGNGVLLADEMGLGKTLMTISLIWTLLKQSPDPKKFHELNKVLIICPVTLINNWQKEFKKWLNLNQLGVLVIDNNTNSSNYKQIFTNFNKSNVHQIMIMSYERLLNVEGEISNCQFDLLVCDEGHKLKNNTNKSLKILVDLEIEKKILLTGTPIQNNLTEFYNLINFLNRGILGTFNKFQRNYVKPIENSRDVNCFNKEIIKLGKSASKELTEITRKIMLRRTNEILFKYLNSKTDVLVFVKPNSLQLELFDLMLSNISFSSVENQNVLNLINVFKKICGSPNLLTEESMFKSSVPDFNKDLSISSGKIEMLIMLLLEISNVQKEKVVIVSNFTKTLDIIESVMKKLNFESLRLDGSTSSSARSSVINKFNTVSFPKYPVFLLSSKSGGFGINLIGASRLILFDNDWNPANDLQAMSRVYRDGQLKPVVIYRLFTTGCLDEKVFQRQLMKNNLSDKFLDDGKNNSNVFDMDDLKDLFTVSNDTNCNTHDLLQCGCEGLGTNESELFLPSQETDLDSSIIQGEDAESLGVMSALNYSQIEKEKKPSIKNALSDYKHFDPSNQSFNCDDEVVNNIVKKTKGGIVSYVFTKVSNPSSNPTPEPEFLVESARGKDTHKESQVEIKLEKSSQKEDESDDDLLIKSENESENESQNESENESEDESENESAFESQNQSNESENEEYD